MIQIIKKQVQNIVAKPYIFYKRTEYRFLKRNYPELVRFFGLFGQRPSLRKKLGVDDLQIKTHPLLTSVPELAQFFIDNKKRFMHSYSLLNVGIGLNVLPHWLTFFNDVLQYEFVGSIELWQPYIWQWKYHKDFPVWQGDVRDIARFVDYKSIDTFLWAQGPEHVPTSDFLQTYKDIKKVTRHHILFISPWGSAYDYQEDINDNPHETHVIKSPDEKMYQETNLKILTWGKKDTLDAGMLGYEFLEQ